MKPKRALVIDDEQIVLDSTRRILEGHGMSVETTLFGRDGLAMAVERDWDVVLTDVRMPDIGGMRVLRDVKRAKPSLPVLIITGYASVQSAVQAIQLGASNYIEKPFTPEQLVEAVDQAIAVARERGPEDQRIVHRDQILQVLLRAGSEPAFAQDLVERGASALEGYDLTGPEKLAVLTGDMKWIESQVGKLDAAHSRWLEVRLAAEVW